MSVGHRQEAAIAALLAQPNLTAAASSCGISERTLRRWMTNKAFASRYEKERGKLFIGIVDLLKIDCAGVVQVLVAIANDGKLPAAPRVSAASRIVELTLKTGEMEALEKRIAQLEQLAKERP